MKRVISVDEMIWGGFSRMRRKDKQVLALNLESKVLANECLSLHTAQRNLERIKAMIEMDVLE